MRAIRWIIIAAVVVTAITATIAMFSGSSPNSPKGETELVISGPADSLMYVKLWKSVDSLDGKGLPKSALEIVTKIYGLAIKNNHPDQAVKARIYQLRYRNELEENAFEKILHELEREADSLKYPYDAIYHSLSAEMYWMYYQANRYKFYNRSQTVNFDNNDIETWDLNHLADACIKHYLASLKDSEKLKNESIKKFSAMLSLGEKTGHLRPTLYDFLAHRAIEFFSSSELALSRPADFFQLKEEFWFNDAADFVSRKITTNDTLSMQFHGVLLLQNLLAFHLQDPSPEALIDADLLRLNFVKTNSVSEGKDSLYLLALEKLEKKYPKVTYCGEVMIRIANHLNQMGAYYQPADSSTIAYKWHHKLAKEKCRDIITRFPKTNPAIIATNLISTLDDKNLVFTNEEVGTSDQRFVMRLEYRNVSKVYVKIGSIKRETLKTLREKYYNYELADKLLKETVLVKEVSFDLPDDGDLHNHSTELILDSLKKGTYVIFASSRPDYNFTNEILAWAPVYMSDISYLFKQEPKGGGYLYALHRNTGKPLAGAEVQVIYNKYNYTLRKYVNQLGKKYIADANGFVTIEPIDDKDAYYYGVEIKWNNDFLASDQNFYNYAYNTSDQPAYQTFIFTDRSIYRPGQTVYYKGIVVNKKGDDRSVGAGVSTKVTLYDVNYQIVSEMDVKTNEYGTFNGSFQIPTGLLNGQMQIYTPWGSQYVSVEEYKRPKFHTEITPLEGSFRVNDSVIVKGKATSYAGPPVTEAKVTYRVVRTPVWRGWWWCPYRLSSVEITNGVTTSDEKGIYTIRFKAIPDLTIPQNDYTDFHYTIYADVSDINGETQSDQSLIVVGYTTLVLGISVPGSVNAASKDTFRLSTVNLNGQKLEVSGDLRIYKLKPAPGPLRERRWSVPDRFIYTQEKWNSLYPGNVYQNVPVTSLKTEKQVFSYSFNTAKSSKLFIGEMDKWEPGQYMLTMEALDAFGKKVLHKQYFILYSEKADVIPLAVPAWFVCLNPSCEPGKNVRFLIGTASDDVTMIMEVLHKDKVIDKQLINLNHQQKLIEIPVKEEYRGNFAVSFRSVINNRVYQFDQIVYVPWTNKELDITFETFRDKLLPGEKEEWKIKISGPGGEKVAAEMVATLYDKSLDDLRYHSWYFSIYPSWYSSYYYNGGMFSTESSVQVRRKYTEHMPVPYVSYDRLNWFGFYYSSYNSYRFNKQSGRVANTAYYSMDAPSAGEMLEESEKTAESAPPPPVDESDDNRNEEGQGGKDREGKDLTSETKKSEVRTNLNETAFFYPELKTDENGNLIVSFTIPEALTTWKMLGFAHTKDLKYGMISEELITQKPMMVIPNLPRFLRENDEIFIPAKISNMSETDLSGKITIEIFDPLTGKAVEGWVKDDLTKDFTVKQGGNSLVTWKIKVPEGLGAVSIRIKGSAGKFTDGEESMVPVLSNRMLVTETLPLPIRGNSEKTFRFEKLLASGSSSTLTHFKYTLEFTSNPAWYAVQALPYLFEYPYECSEQVFSRYYANSLASYIANSNPKIKAVFEAWKSSPGSGALLSNLEKNQELKSALLQETPWVLDAQDESQRKRNIGLLFDLNKMSYELNDALNKLEKKQSSNGGWPWFDGMPENRYITQHIICGFGHLQRLGVINLANDSRINKMVENGLGYLDIRIREDYQELLKYYSKEEMKNKHIGYTQIHYLYTRSFFKDIKVPDRCKEAFDYYKGQAEKYWLSESIYMQGMISLASHRFGNKTVPAAIIKSLKERSITHEEMGMYWKEVERGIDWWQAPIETQALLIEAFDEVSNDAAVVEELKIWLLKQKQVQDWKTTKATVEAIYSLLLRGTDLLADDQLVEIMVGDLKIDPRKDESVKVEAGTGYFKKSWEGTLVKPSMGEIRVKKSTPGIAWGAVYWQYFEQLDKITPAETPLKLKKELFIEVLTPSGKVIESLKSGRKLQIGDKIIVRIELRVDRNMEFVHMKDMRASGFEPINIISRYKYQDGLGYYESTKDASTNFFMDYLPKGTYVFEYPLRVAHKGDFSNGITTIQCMYAPEFSSHSEGIRVKVE